MLHKVELNASIREREHGHVTIELSLPLVRSMRNGEEIIQQGLNAVGQLATQELLKEFDTDGDNIVFGNVRYTSKGRILNSNS